MTPKERAAMQQALEALEGGLWDCGPGQDEHDKCNEVITALREALDHSGEANEMVGCAYCNNPLFAGTKCNNCGLVTLAEQAEQKPVAYLCPSFVDNFATGGYETCEQKDYGAFPVYAAPVRTKDLTDDVLQDAVTKAFRKAFHLGQTYCQRCNSESNSKKRKAAATLGFFLKLEDDTRAVIAADRELNK